MLIGGRVFDTENRHYIVGILNVTPDSFTDGGKWDKLDSAIRRAEEMVNEGADIIDVGGESTRPGYTMISEIEEIGRVVPVIEALSRRIDIPISVDTYKSAVAEAALHAGAVFVNDIWGLKYDSEIAGIITRYGAACCLMHNRVNVDYNEFMSDLLEDLRESEGIALDAGIPADKIMVDPGIGFAKTFDLDLEAINRLDLVTRLGYPVMLGVSRKRVVGTALGLPVEERLEGTLAATVIGIMRGCSFVRAHDIKETKRAIMMAEAISGIRG